MRITPCESWPARFAPTSASPISRARSSGAPAPTKTRSLTAFSSAAVLLATLYPPALVQMWWTGLVRSADRLAVHVQSDRLQALVEATDVGRRQIGALEQGGRPGEHAPADRVDRL